LIDNLGRFTWYELVTTDAQAAAAFYTRVMGWGAQNASISGRTYILFTAGPVPVTALTELPRAARETGAKPGWIGYVTVDDVDAAAERVTRLGGSLRIPPMDIPTISRFCIFSDPQSAALALFKPLGPNRPLPAEMGTPGRVGWHELLATDREKALAFYGEVLGWQKGDAQVDGTDTYQLFSAGEQPIGGMLTKPAATPHPFWLYYFDVDDVDAAAKRVTAGGGQVLGGPLVLAGDIWVALCMDPQGVAFALEADRGRRAVGYFERAAPRNPSDPKSRRWSW